MSQRITNISSNNLFRLSRDLEKLRQILGFIIHQVTYPGTITSTEDALEYIPTAEVVNRLMAVALGYDSYVHLQEESQSVLEPTYPTFSEPSFRQTFMSVVFEEISEHFKSLPRAPQEMHMISELLESYLNIVANEGRYSEILVGQPGCGKTLHFKQWLIEYIKTSDKFKQLPVIVFCRDNFVSELREQRPDMFNEKTVNVIEALPDFSNILAEYSEVPINVVSMDPYGGNTYDDDSLFEVSQELAKTSNQHYVLIDEFYMFIGAAVAFKDTKHHILASQQQPFSHDGQTLFSPRDFVWRILEPDSMTKFMCAVGAWEDEEQFLPLAERMMPTSTVNPLLKSAASLVKGAAILTVPAQWKLELFD